MKKTQQKKLQVRLEELFWFHFWQGPTNCLWVSEDTFLKQTFDNRNKGIITEWFQLGTDFKGFLKHTLSKA